MENTYEDEYRSLPNPKGPKHHAARACREKLDVIKNATYLCQRTEALLELKGSLEKAYQKLQENLDVEDGLLSGQEQCEKNAKKAVETTAVENLRELKLIW